MTDTPTPPAFRHAFRPGEMLPEAEWSRFERYLPRHADEADAAYAVRLAHHNLAVLLESDTARDMPEFRLVLAEAQERGLPIAMLTAPDPTPAEARTEPFDYAAWRAEYDRRQREGTSPYDPNPE